MTEISSMTSMNLEAAGLATQFCNNLLKQLRGPAPNDMSSSSHKISLGKQPVMTLNSLETSESNVNVGSQAGIEEQHQKRQYTTSRAHLALERSEGVEGGEDRQGRFESEKSLDSEVSEASEEAEESDEDEESDEGHYEERVEYKERTDEGDISAEDVQDLLDRYFHAGKPSSGLNPKKQCYDHSRFEDVWDDGEAVWKPYEKAYTRVSEWRRNWFSDFVKELDQTQDEIKKRDLQIINLHSLPELRAEYLKYFSFETFFSLMGTCQVTIDWRTTLKDLAVNFYIHLSRHDKVTTSRHNVLQKINLIASSKQFDHIPVDILIVLPERPIKRTRKPVKQPECIEEADSEFEVIPGKVEGV
ncbi:hypothetical protein RUND412_008054 [Rhizina undulata]